MDLLIAFSIGAITVAVVVFAARYREHSARDDGLNPHLQPRRSYGD